MPFTPLKAYPNFGTVNVVPPTPFPTVIADGATWDSDLIAGGFGGAIFGATSDHAATMNIQRYADLAGTIPVGPLSTQDMSADTPAWTGFADSLPYVCFNAQIVNGAGAVANITGASILLGSLS